MGVLHKGYRSDWSWQYSDCTVTKHTPSSLSLWRVWLEGLVVDCSMLVCFISPSSPSKGPSTGFCLCGLLAANDLVECGQLCGCKQQYFSCHSATAEEQNHIQRVSPVWWIYHFNQRLQFTFGPQRLFPGISRPLPSSSYPSLFPPSLLPPAPLNPTKRRGIPPICELVRRPLSLPTGRWISRGWRREAFLHGPPWWWFVTVYWWPTELVWARSGAVWCTLHQLDSK